MKHPLSVWSNLIYIVGGMIVAMSGAPSGILVGISMVVMGMGSGWYHWKRTAEHQLADERGMYLTFGNLIGAAALPLMPAITPLGTWAVLSVIMGGSILLASQAHKEDVDSMTVLPVLVILLLVLIGLVRGWESALILFVGYLAIAVWRELPERNFWSPPEVFQRFYDPVHAVWHMGTGVWIPFTYYVATALPWPTFLHLPW